MAFGRPQRCPGRTPAQTPSLRELAAPQGRTPQGEGAGTRRGLGVCGTSPAPLTAHGTTGMFIRPSVHQQNCFKLTCMDTHLSSLNMYFLLKRCISFFPFCFCGVLWFCCCFVVWVFFFLIFAEQQLPIAENMCRAFYGKTQSILLLHKLVTKTV